MIKIKIWGNNGKHEKTKNKFTRQKRDCTKKRQLYIVSSRAKII